MYPAEFFGLFPPFPQDDRVFVAMDFREEFRPRWDKVLVPAIESIEMDGVRQSAHRVDARTVGDSILTEILTAISRSRLVIADVTAIGVQERRGPRGESGHVALRNANVMYEVGLAHATRLPEEVLLFRSDREPLMFDVAQIRVNAYGPDGAPEAARQTVTEAIVGALKELDLRRHLAVGRAAARLDATSWKILLDVCGLAGGMPHPQIRTMRDVMSNGERLDAMHRLLDAGAIETRLLPNDPDSHRTNEETLRYHVTRFGMALIRHGIHVHGFDSPEFG